MGLIDFFLNLFKKKNSNDIPKVDNNSNLNFLKIKNCFIFPTLLHFIFLIFVLLYDSDYLKSNFDYFNQNTELGTTLYEYVIIFRVYTIIFIVFFFFIFLKISISTLKIYVIFVNISGTFYLLLNIIGTLIYFKYNDNNYCAKDLHNPFDDYCSKNLYYYLSISLILRNLLNYLFTTIIMYFYLNFNFELDNKDNTVNNTGNNDIENNVINV